MEDITQQNCPKGGKHKLSYLKNVYSIACEKCRQVWTRHPQRHTWKRLQSQRLFLL